MVQCFCPVVLVVLKNLYAVLELVQAQTYYVDDTGEHLLESISCMCLP